MAEENLRTKRILAVGDVMLGRLVDAIMPEHNHDPENELHAKMLVGRDLDSAMLLKASGSHRYVWGDTLRWFHDVDLRIINLETSITSYPQKWPGQAFNFRMHPANVKALQEARVNFCSLANNHILDFKHPGMHDTMGALRKAGIAFAGCGDNVNEAAAPAYAQLDGVKIAFISASDHFDYWAAKPNEAGIHYINPNRYSKGDIERVRAKAEEARRNGAQLVFFSMHWGPNYAWHPSARIQRLAHDLIDHCGINLIHGTSAHHVQGIEIYNSVPILYGCGDFVDDYAVDAIFRNDLSFLYIFHLSFDTLTWHRLDLIPTKTHNLSVSTSMPLQDRKWLFRKISELSSMYRTSVTHNPLSPDALYSRFTVPLDQSECDT